MINTSDLFFDFEKQPKPDKKPPAYISQCKPFPSKWSDERKFGKNGVYYLLSKDKKLLYIGKSSDVASRLIAYRNDKRFKFYYVEYSFSPEVVEHIRISDLDPPLNGTYWSDYDPLRKIPQSKHLEFAVAFIRKAIYLKQERKKLAAEMTWDITTNYT